MSIKILLADDHKIVRDGLCSLLEKQLDMQIIGMADNGRTAVKLTMELKPDVIIMDINMPDLNGIEATRQILAQDLKSKIIALSMHSDKRFVARMLSAGAAGYLLKDCAFEELVSAIKTVILNKIYISPSIAGVIVNDYVRHLPAAEDPVLSVLTNREIEVIQLLAEGKSTKEIASQLLVSIKTIETYRQHIMTKLNLHSIAELTKYAIREGLTSV